MLLYGALAIVLIWLGIISFLVLKQKKHYNNLISRTKKRNIDEILDAILEKDNQFEKDIENIDKNLRKITEQSKLHFQKIGFLRFNPFERVGGEQSFVISLLDSENNGILLNFLYTREGVRIYAKRVKQGKSEEFELSQEEKEAIKKAN